MHQILFSPEGVSMLQSRSQSRKMSTTLEAGLCMEFPLRSSHCFLTNDEYYHMFILETRGTWILVETDMLEGFFPIMTKLCYCCYGKTDFFLGYSLEMEVLQVSKEFSISTDCNFLHLFGNKSL